MKLNVYRTEEKKMFLFVDDMIFYVENPKQLTKLPELIILIS